MWPAGPFGPCRDQLSPPPPPPPPPWFAAVTRNRATGRAGSSGNGYALATDPDSTRSPAATCHQLSKTDPYGLEQTVAAVAAASQQNVDIDICPSSANPCFITPAEPGESLDFEKLMPKGVNGTASCDVDYLCYLCYCYADSDLTSGSSHEDDSYCSDYTKWFVRPMEWLKIIMTGSFAFVNILIKVSHCLCLARPLHSWLRHRLLPCVSTTFVAKTPPLPCVSAAFVAKTLPLLCGLRCLLG